MERYSYWIRIHELFQDDYMGIKTELLYMSDHPMIVGTMYVNIHTDQLFTVVREAKK